MRLCSHAPRSQTPNTLLHLAADAHGFLHLNLDTVGLSGMVALVLSILVLNLRSVVRMLDVGSDDSVLMFFQLAADVACCRLLTAGKKGPSRFLVRSPVFLVKPGTQVLYGAFRISRRTWYAKQGTDLMSGATVFFYAKPGAEYCFGFFQVSGDCCTYGLSST